MGEDGKMTADGAPPASMPPAAAPQAAAPQAAGTQAAAGQATVAGGTGAASTVSAEERRAFLIGLIRQVRSDTIAILFESASLPELEGFVASLRKTAELIGIPMPDDPPAPDAEDEDENTAVSVAKMGAAPRHVHERPSLDAPPVRTAEEQRRDMLLTIGGLLKDLTMASRTATLSELEQVQLSLKSAIAKVSPKTASGGGQTHPAPTHGTAAHGTGHAPAQPAPHTPARPGGDSSGTSGAAQAAAGRALPPQPGSATAAGGRGFGPAVGVGRAGAAPAPPPARPVVGSPPRSQLPEGYPALKPPPPRR